MLSVFLHKTAPAKSAVFGTFHSKLWLDSKIVGLVQFPCIDGTNLSLCRFCAGQQASVPPYNSSSSRYRTIIKN